MLFPMMFIVETIVSASSRVSMLENKVMLSFLRQIFYAAKRTNHIGAFPIMLF